MNDAIITALITGGVSLSVCMINTHYQAKNIKAKHDETISLIEYKLDELTKRVDKHNNVIERTYALEREASLLDEKLKVANHRLDDLEKKEE